MIYTRPTGFPPSVLKAGRERADGRCENPACGKRARLEAHHRRALRRYGANTLENCLLLCCEGSGGGCHGLYDRAEMRQIESENRRAKRRAGTGPVSKIKSRGFDKRLTKGFDGKVRKR